MKLAKKLDTEGKQIISASSIGHPCIRKIWKGNIEGIQEPITRATQRIFDMGNWLESLVVKWMREDGWEVAENEGGREARFLSIVRCNDNVEIHGHHDIIARMPGEKIVYMMDIKTMKSRSYDFWKKLGTVEKYPQYAQQVHAYAKPDKLLEWVATDKEKDEDGNEVKVKLFSEEEPYSIPNLGIVGANKDTAEYDIDKFPFMEQMHADIIAKALEVASFTTEPPIDKNIPKWCCNYCGYKREGFCDGV